MAKDFEILKAELLLEVAYAQPMFNIFDSSSLVDKIFTRLEKYGLRLSDLRTEDSSIIGDRYLQCYLFNYVMTVKIRYDKVEITCTEFPRSHVDNFISGILDVLNAVKEFPQHISYKTFSTAIACHGRIEGQTTMEFLSKMPMQIPAGLGPSIGSGVVFYYGQENDRLLSSLTLDMSALIRDALFIRTHGTWDAGRIPVESLPKMIKEFFAQALGAVGLQQKQ